jgi:hypothetical protein
MPTKKPRLMLTLEPDTRNKLEVLANTYGVSMAAMVKILIRQAKIPKFDGLEDKMT